MDCSLPAPLSVWFPRQESWSEFAISFSRWSSQPRGWTRVSYIADGFFTTELPGKPSSVTTLVLTLRPCVLAFTHAEGNSLLGSLSFKFFVHTMKLAGLDRNWTHTLGSENAEFEPLKPQWIPPVGLSDKPWGQLWPLLSGPQTLNSWDLHGSYQICG